MPPTASWHWGTTLCTVKQHAVEVSWAYLIWQARSSIQEVLTLGGQQCCQRLHQLLLLVDLSLCTQKAQVKPCEPKAAVPRRMLQSRGCEAIHDMSASQCCMPSNLRPE